MVLTACDTLNDIWAIDNLVDTATLDGTSADPALGVDRLKDPRLGVVWRTPGSAETLKIEFATPQQIDIVSIHGLSTTDPQMFLAMGTAAGLSDIRSGAWAPTIDPYARQAVWLAEVDGPGDGVPDPMPLVKQIRIGFTAGNTDVGRVWAGPAHWTPRTSHIYGSEQGMADLSVIQRGQRSGAMFSSPGTVLRGHSVEYDAIPEAEWNEEVYSLNLARAAHGQILYIPNHAVYPRNKHAICGYQQELNPIAALGFDRFQKTFVILEAG